MSADSDRRRAAERANCTSEITRQRITMAASVQRRRRAMAESCAATRFGFHSPPPLPPFRFSFFLYIRPSFVTGLYNRVKESFFCVVLHFPVGFFCYPITTISSSARLFSFYNFVNIVFSSFSIVTSQQLLILRLT